MRLFLYGISAFFYWLNERNAPMASNRASTRAFENCEPTEESLSHLAICLPALPKPFHVAIPSRHRRLPRESVRHQCGRQPSGKAFYRVASGVYAPCPELCFTQLAQELPFHELVRAGSALCGCFRLDLKRDGMLEKRSTLTTKQRIGAFLRAHSGLPGVKNAHRALPFVVGGAASPPEVFLAMVLSLPFRHGGFQVEGLEVNRRLRPTKRARALSGRETLVPDLLIPGNHLVIEYDSTKEHTAAAQLTRDAQKRLALEADGYKVITVTTKQLANRMEMQRIAQQIYRHQKRRFRPQSKLFADQQQRLFRMGWSLNG